MKIYSKEGRLLTEVEKFQYQGTFMGESFLSLDINSPEPIDFKIGDYIEYRDEIYILNSTSSITKNSSVRSVGNAFKYEGLKFDSLAYELKVCDFLDYVLNDNNIHFSSLPSFSFYASSVQDLANRIQANLDRIYIGEQKWSIIVQSEFVTVKNINIDISSIKVWDALEFVNSKFNANFIIRGRVITIGTKGIEPENIFKYGKGNGLFKLQRTEDESQEIITRLRAYGSTRNLPVRYYNTLIDPIIEAPILAVRYDRISIAAYLTFGFKPVSSSPDNEITVLINGKGYKLYGVGEREVYILTHNLNEMESIHTGLMVRFTSGIDYNKVPNKYKIPSGKVVPASMIVQNLMLPDFPETTLDPYLDSSNITTLGIREASVFFDGSGDHEEIFPSMEGMTAWQLEDAGITVSLDIGDNGNLDEISSAEQLTDNGIFDENDTIKPFKIYLKDIGFDINEHLTSEAATISMKSGMCGGREFEILGGANKPYKEGNKWVITCNRSEDSGIGIYFPNKDYQIKDGDKFVLLNIEMPEIYIKAASHRLLKVAKDYLSKKDYVKYNYEPTIDAVEMARQHKEAKANGKISLYETIKEGDRIHIKDNELDIDKSLFIKQLIIKEGDNIIPQYSIVLSEEGVINYRIHDFIGGIYANIADLEKHSKMYASDKNVNKLKKSVVNIQSGVAELQTSVDEVKDNTYTKIEANSKFEVKGEFKGEWQEGKEYIRNNRVGYRGCMYLCIVDSTFSKPGYDSHDWFLEQGNPDFVMEIQSSAGEVFIGNDVDTDLIAEVQIYNQDITSTIPSAQWTWTRSSSYKESDIIWNAAHIGVGNSVHITLNDLPGFGQRIIAFTCTAYVDNNNKVTQEILI